MIEPVIVLSELATILTSAEAFVAESRLAAVQLSANLATDCSIFARCRRCSVQYVATQCGVVYELGERRETDLVGQVC